MEHAIWIERLFNVVIAALGILGLVGHRLKSDRRFKSMFVYYTNQSNLLIIIYELVWLISGCFERPNAVYSLVTSPVLQLCMMLCIFNTFIIFHFVLAAGAKKKGCDVNDCAFGWVYNFCVHYSVPLLTVLQWLIVADRSGLTLLSGLVWLVIPVAYLSYVLLRAPFVEASEFVVKYPYGFMNVDQLGVKKFAAIIAVLLVFYSALAVAMTAIGKWLDHLYSLVLTKQ